MVREQEQCEFCLVKDDPASSDDPNTEKLDECINCDRQFAFSLTPAARLDVLWQSTLAICSHLSPDNGRDHALAVLRSPHKFTYNAAQLIAIMKNHHARDGPTIDAMLKRPMLDHRKGWKINERLPEKVSQKKTGQ